MALGGCDVSRRNVGLGLAMRLSIGCGAMYRRSVSSRRGRRAFAAVAAMIVVFCLTTARLFVWPTQGMPAHVSAVVMLAGPGDRLSVALQLAKEHRSLVLVVSQGQHGYGGPCPPKPSGVELICFDPDPGNTRGEAEYLGRLARRFHWNSVALVTTRSQDTRARMMVQRCFGGSVYVVTAPLAAGSWPYQIAYEWGALFKALFLDRAC
jgi:uncharacterized SAM-binding protein YcdF (DUF218 family)